MSRYRLTGRLESSELSELYAAIRGDDEAVVIKLFHARTSDVRYAQELAETARLLGTVRAPGIVRFVELGLIRDRLAVVRQAVEGIPLGQLLRRLTAREFLLSPMVAIALVLQLLELLHAAHEAHAVHGALTPGNVLLTSAGHPAVFDFGALKALNAVPALRKSYGARGRDAYRAPEVVKGDAPAIASDVYSSGAILYELLTLREPLADRTSGTIATRTHAVPAPSRLDRRLSGRLDPIVLRALELSANRRYHSAQEFSLALRNFLANNGGMPAPDELRRLLEPIRTGDATVNLGPVPFSEPFVLREVRGAELPPVTEEADLVELRPSFSGPRPAELDPEPAFDDGTDPGQPAPPGTPRRPPPPAGSVLASRPVLRHPRGKPLETTQPEDSTPIDAVTRRAGAETTAPMPTVSVPPPEVRPGTLLPPPLGLEITGPLDASGLPRDTLERPRVEPFFLDEPGRRRRRLYWMLALAAAGGLAIFVGLQRFTGLGALPTPSHPGPEPAGGVTDPGEEPSDPALRTVNGALRRYFEAEGQEGEPADEAELPAAEATFHQAAPKEHAAFLSVSVDVPAVVYIDDLRVRRRPPLLRYPLEPGVRRILIETAGGERRSFDLAFEKGQLRRIDERFQR